MSKILIVDDDIASCRTIQLHLGAQGHEVHIAHSAEEGTKAASCARPDLIILDIRMPGMSGLDVLPTWKQDFPDTHVIMITAFHDMESTIQAMQRGADDYIQKPIDIGELDTAVARALAHAHSDTGEMVVTRPDGGTPRRDTIVGRSRIMKEVFKTIGLVAPSMATVLITGESGTGKELVARAIHRAGYNPAGALVAVNCAAMVETLLESDMFGHEKGAFTGAVAHQAGKFALADQGTLFLDEISELSPVMQAKLLRVLQEKEYTPLGAREARRTNARVIAATNVDLRECVDDGGFREDLYYRLQVVNIHLPPLRERKDDIPDLIQALLTRINAEMRRSVSKIAADVMAYLQSYDWPGNIRELENVLMKAVALCPSDIITVDLLPESMRDAPLSIQEERPVSQLRLQEVIKRHTQLVLETNRWHKGQACKILGVSRPRLRRMIQQYGLIFPAGSSDNAPDDPDASDSDDQPA